MNNLELKPQDASGQRGGDGLDPSQVRPLTCCFFPFPSMGFDIALALG